jgi:chaperonin GroES
MKEIKPVNGHIVVKELQESDQMVGNIFLPDMGKEKPLICEVMAVSNTYTWHNGTSVEAEVLVGDMALIPRMGSQRVSIDNEDFIVCKSTDIIGIVK